MKKKTKLAVTCAILSLPFAASATTNLENPLYIPESGAAYAKIAAGVMYKIADNTAAMTAKGWAEQEEWPIYRGQLDVGYGITDRLTARASVGYTQDDDINRKGMHQGRLGLNYRVFEGNESTSGLVWDLYADAHLGGISKMTGEYTPTGFNYDNYTNGRWGFFAGTQFGKTWDKFTAAVFGEIHQTFGNSNNDIDVTKMKAVGAAGIAGNEAYVSACTANPAASPMCGALLQGAGLASLTDSLSVNLKSTTEWAAGLKTAYEIDEEWTIGGSFTYKYRAANGIKSVATEQNNPLAQAVANALAASMSDMRDGIEEYTVGASVAHQVSETMQIALYGDYTFDDAEPMSQNGTDVKFEIGFRLNARF